VYSLCFMFLCALVQRRYSKETRGKVCYSRLPCYCCQKCPKFSSDAANIVEETVASSLIRIC